MELNVSILNHDSHFGKFHIVTEYRTFMKTTETIHVHTLGFISQHDLLQVVDMQIGGHGH